MQQHPFTLLKPFASTLDVALLTKADNVRTDDDVARVTGAKRIASLHQMHGNVTALVREPTSRMIEADGMITDTKDLLLSIRMADCQTFVVYAPEENIVGVMHVGWKCLKAGMIASFFRALDGFFSVKASDVLIGAGPSLCTKCAGFSDPEKELEGTEGLIIEGKCVDLIGTANAQLKNAGVNMKNVERDPRCTRCDPKSLWTYRGGDHDKVVEGWTNILCAKLK